MKITRLVSREKSAAILKLNQTAQMKKQVDDLLKLAKEAVEDEEIILKNPSAIELSDRSAKLKVRKFKSREEELTEQDSVTILLEKVKPENALQANDAEK